MGEGNSPHRFSSMDGLFLFLVGFAALSWVVQPEAMASGWILVGGWGDQFVFDFFAGSVGLFGMSR